MSQSVEDGSGDAELNPGVELGGVRHAENDVGLDDVPKKRLKSDDVQLDDAENDFPQEEDDAENDFPHEEDDAGVLDEEDLDEADQEDFVDEEEDDINQEAIVDDVGESSDVDEFIQLNLNNISDCQYEIEDLNKKANNEILKVEQKYNQLRLPVYAKRSQHIDQIPHFWCTVFSRHPQLKRVITEEDADCLKQLTRIQINDFEDGRSGYQMKFYFSENPWFTNSVITKEYTLPWHESPSCVCTPIEWRDGMNLTKRSASFFSWFCSQDDASTDDIAEIIKEELWPDPLQCYWLPNQEEGSEKSSSDDEPVYDGEEDEYNSSEEEGWKKRPALGKEAPRPGRGNEEQYYDAQESEEELGAIMPDQEDEDLDEDDLLEEEKTGTDLAAEPLDDELLEIPQPQETSPSSSSKNTTGNDAADDTSQDSLNDGESEDPGT